MIGRKRAHLHHVESGASTTSYFLGSNQSFRLFWSLVVDAEIGLRLTHECNHLVHPLSIISLPVDPLAVRVYSNPGAQVPRRLPLLYLRRDIRPGSTVFCSGSRIRAASSSQLHLRLDVARVC